MVFVYLIYIYISIESSPFHDAKTLHINKASEIVYRIFLI